MESELQGLAKTLQDEGSVGLARRILEQCFREEDVQASAVLKLKVGRQLALCTYTDPDLPLDARSDTARRLLEQVDQLDSTIDQETLGLAGAVYKRLWEAGARKQDLERSLSFYLRGWQQGPSKDQGYTGINAAYVLDLLAAQEIVDTGGGAIAISDPAQGRLAKASQIRQNIIETVPRPNAGTSDDWWPLVTLAEAYFGLGQFDQAGPLLQKASSLPGVSDWRRQTTTRQMGGVVRLRSKLPIPNQRPIDEAWQALSLLVGGNRAAVENAFYGRVGLALSGGGLRAALFHIGVLARLTELDLLRGMECLSCVSGGSIIGAYYYLHVRNLLQTKTDVQITPDDYIQMVERIADEFLAGIQRNIRTRVAAEWITNLKMIFCPNYSRTSRVGELYERELFRRIRDGEQNKERWLNELLIQPLGEPENFAPKTHNWKRRARVPTLVINATTLNTGHNWQFTATWMGEPPGGINTEIDANYRLRRLYHDEGPPGHRRMRLGYAVAASSCVPGLFEPLPLANLYPDRTVRLVDGGVHDNQGTGALIEDDCNVIIVSDASGQMDAINDPSSGLLSVPLRANSVLQSRVREAQFRELFTRRRAGLLSGFVFLHLKKNLGAEAIDWIDSQYPSKPGILNPLTKYGIQKRVQRQLAAIRTDLDSFSDTEAYALMTSGYRMTMEALRQRGVVGFDVFEHTRRNWKFLAVEREMTVPTPSTSFMRRLKAAEFITFKVWRLSRMLQFGAFFVSMALVLVIVIQWQDWSSLMLPRLHPQLTFGVLLTIMLGAATFAVIGPALLRAGRFPKTFQQIADRNRHGTLRICCRAPSSSFF